jgi:hypothetical protein
VLCVMRCAHLLRGDADGEGRRARGVMRDDGMHGANLCTNCTL